jgi:hypothetical protein
MSFINANVVMLPTNQKTDGMICKDITGQDKIIAIKTKYLMAHEDYIGHHLYVISDDEIKEGDWCYHSEISQEYTIIKDSIKSKRLHPAKGVFQWKKTENVWYKKAKKIIASTDGSLNNLPEKPNFSSYMSFSLGNPLPQPSQQFIQKYIEEYNKGNVITNVLVEYENKFDGKEYVDELDAYGYDKVKSILKINPQDNTITIKIAKDSWSREEVIEFANKVKEYCENGWKSDSLHSVFFEWDKWVEKNL